MPVRPERLRAHVEELSPSLSAIARRIHEHPELRFEEHQAAKWLAEAVEAAGVPVERGVGGLPTAFRAKVGKPGGPRVAVLAEYDALPEIGHACGHNLIAASALGAFLALAREQNDLEGEVVLLGTPAEEGGGGKIDLIDAGAFEGLDAALMIHPFDRDLLAHHTLASTYLELSFRGTPSHAAMAPEEGASALTACLDTFRLIDGQRVHFKDGVRVHGIVTDGGQAVNIVPERAKSELSVRALDAVELERVVGIVERCARGAALASGVEIEIHRRRGYKNMINNLELVRRFGAHLAATGRSGKEHDATVGAGSTDMGDVSHVVPSIHAWLAICDEGETTCHQHAFAAYASSDRGMKAAHDGAFALAATAADVLADAGLRQRAREEHGAARRA